MRSAVARMAFAMAMCTALAIVVLAASAGRAGAVVLFDETRFGETIGAPRSIETVDLDADGDLDVLAAASSYDDQIKLWRAQPAGTLFEHTLPGPGALGLARPVDITGDGRLDIVYARGGQHADTDPPRGVVVQAGVPGGGLGAPVTTSIPRATDVATGDFDGDTYADAIVATGPSTASGDHSGGYRVLHGKPDGTFTVGQSVDFLDATVYRVEVGDIDGGGQDDAVLLTYRGTRVALGGARADGTPSGILTTMAPIDAETLAHGALRVADVDDDGRDDVISARCCEPPLGTFLRLGRSDGTLEAPVRLFEASVSDIAVGDIDDDGNLDVLGANHYTGIEVAYGVGDGTFDPGETLQIAGISHIFHLSAIAVADVTADGIDDVLVGDDYSSTGIMSLLRNAPYLTVSELDLDFGEVIPGGRATLPLTVGNDGIAPLNVSGVEVHGAGFSTHADRCSGQRLAYAETCSLGVAYSSGDYDRADEGDVILVSDDVEPRIAIGLFGFSPARPVAPVVPPTTPSPPAAPAPRSAAVSAAEGLRAALRALRRQGIGGLRAGRVRFGFTAPRGSVRVTLREKRRGRRTGMTLATAKASVRSTRRITMRLKLTTHGRTRLRRARRVGALLRVTVNPSAAASRTRSTRTLLRTTRIR